MDVSPYSPRDLDELPLYLYFLVVLGHDAPLVLLVILGVLVENLVQ